MIKRLFPVLAVTSGAMFLLWLMEKYLPILKNEALMNQEKDEEEQVDAESKSDENFEEKRRAGYEDRRKALREWSMSRPRRKDEMIH